MHTLGVLWTSNSQHCLSVCHHFYALPRPTGVPCCRFISHTRLNDTMTRSTETVSAIVNWVTWRQIAIAVVAPDAHLSSHALHVQVQAIRSDDRTENHSELLLAWINSSSINNNMRRRHTRLRSMQLNSISMRSHHSRCAIGSERRCKATTKHRW